MRGRLQVGIDAEIAISNPEKVDGGSSYEKGEQGLPSRGIPHLAVNSANSAKEEPDKNLLSSHATGATGNASHRRLIANNRNANNAWWGDRNTGYRDTVASATCCKHDLLRLGRLTPKIVALDKRLHDLIDRAGGNG